MLKTKRKKFGRYEASKRSGRRGRGRGDDERSSLSATEARNEFFLFAPQLSSGSIKQEKKEEKERREKYDWKIVEKNRLRFERSYSNRGLDLMEIFLSTSTAIRALSVQ